MGFIFAAEPVPPITGGQTEPGGLVFVVLLDVLADVSHDHVEFFLFGLFFQGNAVHGHRIDGKFCSVAIEEFEHVGVFHAAVDEHHVDECVEIVGILFPTKSLWFVFNCGIFNKLNLFFLILFQPFDAAFQNAGH